MNNFDANFNKLAPVVGGQINEETAGDLGRCFFFVMEKVKKLIHILSSLKNSY